MENYRLGIVTAIFEIIFSIAIATFVKFLSADISVFVILLFRYLFCMPLLLIIGFMQRGNELLKADNRPVLIARTTLGILGLATWFLAIPILGIIKATVLGQLMAIFITFFAPLLLKEKITLGGWLAITFGFLGTLIILRPDLEGWWNYGIIFGILAPFFAGLMNISLRKLGDSDWPITTALWYNFAGAVLFSGICFLGNYQIPLDKVTLLILIIVGLIASLQQFVLAVSRAHAPAVNLAPISYLMVPSSIFVGVLLFKETITTSLVVGSIVIIGSAYYTVRKRQ